MVICALVFMGCGRESPLAQVKGTVLLNDEPLTTGSIMTLPSSGRGSNGTIQKDGTFQLKTVGEGDGARIGTHKVAVVAYESQEKGPEAKTGKLLVPERYTNPETSDLTIEVKAGEVNAPTLKLTSQ
jgi:hypothetical protein